jgi:hypothetical protein
VKLPELPNLIRIRSVTCARHLEDRRQLLDGGMGEERAEPLAELALADIRVPVAVRPQRGVGVVHVQRTEPVETDGVVEFAQQRVERR